MAARRRMDGSELPREEYSGWLGDDFRSPTNDHGIPPREGIQADEVVICENNDKIAKQAMFVDENVTVIVQERYFQLQYPTFGVRFLHVPANQNLIH